jgi:hypothetical protein
LIRDAEGKFHVDVLMQRVSEFAAEEGSASCKYRYKVLCVMRSEGYGEEGRGTMVKSLVVIAALAVAAPSVALAQGNSNNTPAWQNANGVPFTGNDPAASSFNSSPSLPVVVGTVPGCSVITADPDDRNRPNGDDKNPGHGNPHCQPASP